MRSRSAGQGQRSGPVMVTSVRHSPAIVGQLHSDKACPRTSQKVSCRSVCRSAGFMARRRRGCVGDGARYTYDIAQAGTEGLGLSLDRAHGQRV